MEGSERTTWEAKSNKSGSLIEQIESLLDLIWFDIVADEYEGAFSQLQPFMQSHVDPSALTPSSPEAVAASKLYVSISVLT